MRMRTRSGYTGVLMYVYVMLHYLMSSHLIMILSYLMLTHPIMIVSYLILTHPIMILTYLILSCLQEDLKNLNFKWSLLNKTQLGKVWEEAFGKDDVPVPHLQLCMWQVRRDEMVRLLVQREKEKRHDYESQLQVCYVILSYLILSYLILSYLILSHLILSYFKLSSYLISFYPVLYYVAFRRTWRTCTGNG